MHGVSPARRVVTPDRRVVTPARRGVTPCGLSPRGPWAGSMLQLGTLHTAYTPVTPTHSDSTVILELHTLAKAPLTLLLVRLGMGARGHLLTVFSA